MGRYTKSQEDRGCCSSPSAICSLQCLQWLSSMFNSNFWLQQVKTQHTQNYIIYKILKYFISNEKKKILFCYIILKFISYSFTLYIIILQHILVFCSAFLSLSLGFYTVFCLNDLRERKGIFKKREREMEAQLVISLGHSSNSRFLVTETRIEEESEAIEVNNKE